MKTVKLICIAMIISLIIFTACSKEDLSDLTTPSTLRNVIKSVTITPNTATVTKGQTFQFTPIVDAIGETSQTVTWTITNGTPETSIDTNGLLAVNINETATELIISATSTVDPSKSGTATVTLSEPPPIVTNVEVTPAEVTVTRGEQQQFTAVVSGEYNPSPEVTWSVTDGVIGTTINSEGLLIISIGETATSLTVTATSTEDPSKSGNATVTVADIPSTVTSVVISPDTATVTKGTTRQFTAEVIGDNNPSQEVIWAVTGGIAETNIGTNGLLTVDINETATSLTITATSVQDLEIAGTAIITVTDPPSTVTSVDVHPSTYTILKGQQHQFTAVVNGEYSPSQEVTWAVTGGITETNISINGLLTVDINETATSLIITATSEQDPAIIGTATVTVNEIYNPPIITSIDVSPATATVVKGETQSFSATVIGENNPPQEVTWSVTTGVAGTTINESGLLIIDIAETAISLTVTATSVYDPTKTGTATVTVANPPSTVTSVEVNPATWTIIKGQQHQFTSTVHGDYSPSQEVIWSLTGETGDTNINSNGLLTVDINETANSLIVIATSVQDTDIYGEANVTVIDPPPTVTSIEVTPATSTVTKGFSEQFHAEVFGTHNPPQTVNWAVNSELSTINENGLLTVNTNETAPTLTVTATSTFDTTQSGTATVTVSDIPPTVTSVEVSPATVTVGLGSTQQFTAEVHGDYAPPQDVTWSLAGNTSSATNIINGLLSIDLTETTTELIVTATSVYDNTQSGTATVTIPQITDITLTPPSPVLDRGSTQQFSVSVNGSPGISQSVQWSLHDNNSSSTILTETGHLTVGANETATAITVKATSIYDSSKYGIATVAIRQITSVTVTPQTSTVSIGTTLQFYSDVTGVNVPPQNVLWSVTGGTGGTHIDTDGLLTVANSETATTFTVTATSTYDNSQTGSATVHIKQVISIAVTPNNQRVLRQETQQYTANVTVANGASEYVIWTVSGNTSQDETVIDEYGLLTVSIGEFNSDLTVTATSTYNPAISGSTTVCVPQITDFEVIPTQLIILRGHSQQFTVDIDGIYDPPENVYWYISDTWESSFVSGLLTVGEYESHPLLVVRATSLYDPWSIDETDVWVVEVDAITIDPPSPNVLKGSTQQFTAEVDGFGANQIQDIWKAVTWTVSPSTNGSTISETGLLTVANSEPALSLTVTATSVVDPTKSSSTTVNVSTVIGVIIDPEDGEILKGATQQFTAVVLGTNNPPQAVTWEIAYPYSGPSSISNSGLLTVDIDETANTLNIRAISVADPLFSWTSLMTVRSVTSVVISPSTVGFGLERGQSRIFYATVNGTNNPYQAVRWTVTGGSATYPSPVGLGGYTLNVATNETSSSLTLTATSELDPTKSDSINIPVVQATAVTVSPATTTISRANGQRQFTASVTGSNGPPQGVTWSLSGGSPHSAIGSNGLLMCTQYESSNTLTVTATSTYDNTVFGTATVTVTGALPTVGQQGPGSGYIFYDKGEFSDGWRFLEAAPVTSEFTAPWGLYGIDCIGTNEGVGTGKANTALIIDLLEQNGEIDKAAQICDALLIYGYRGWFLPSRDELTAMYNVLCAGSNIGGFNTGSNIDAWYWSSSANNTVNNGSIYRHTWYRNFSNNTQDQAFGRESQSLNVRPVRRF